MSYDRQMDAYALARITVSMLESARLQVEMITVEGVADDERLAKVCDRVGEILRKEMSRQCKVADKIMRDRAGAA